jgi:hypothetical protein
MLVFVGFALQWSGYVPNAEQTALTKGVLLFLLAGLPAICYGIGVVAFRRFTLNRAETARIRRELDLRFRADSSRGTDRVLILAFYASALSEVHSGMTRGPEPGAAAQAAVALRAPCILLKSLHFPC